MCLPVPSNTLRAQQYAPPSLCVSGAASQSAGAAAPAASSQPSGSYENKAIDDDDVDSSFHACYAQTQPFFGLSMQTYERAHQQQPQQAPGASLAAAGLGFAGLSPVPSSSAPVATALAAAPPTTSYMIRPKPSKGGGGKRRRVPQPPGKTATDKARLFVQHNYHDLSLVPDASGSAEAKPAGKAAPDSESFPVKLHRILEETDANGESHIISWQPHGRAFRIHDPKAFTAQIMARYFPKMQKLTSLQRQFNLYGFERLTKEGPDQGAYYHEAFLRYRPALSAQRMFRRRVKGTGYKASGNPDAEPELYSYKSMDEVMGKGTTSAGALPNTFASIVTESSSSNTSHASSGEESNPFGAMPAAQAQAWLACQSLDSQSLQEPAPPRAQPRNPLRNSLVDIIEDSLLRDFFAAHPAADATPRSPVVLGMPYQGTADLAPPPPPLADHPTLMDFVNLWERASFQMK